MSAFDSLSTLPVLPMAEGVAARAIQGELMTFAVIELAPHARVARHEHPHEQVGLLLSGSVAYVIGGERRQLQPGDTYFAAGGVAHEAVAGPDGAVIVDVFSPVRADWSRFVPEPARTLTWP